MTLRLRILLGYGYLVGLLLVVAGGSLLGFFRLSEGIGAVLEDNYSTIRAAMTMAEALERQDSALLAALVDGADGGAEEDDGRFREALERAEANVTEATEPAILARIRERYEAYRRARTALLEDVPARPLEAYDQQVQAKFSAVQREVSRLLEANQEAMLRADREARRTALRNGTGLALVVTVALVSLLVLSRALHRDLLSRLENLRADLETFDRGEPQRRLVPAGDDELAAIADHVNRLLDRHQRREADARGRIALQRRLVLALLELGGDGALLLDHRGRRIAGAGELPEGFAARLRKGASSDAPESAAATVRLRDATWRPPDWEARALGADGGEPIAWVVRPAAGR